MAEKEITLLKAQREKLSGKSFDLEGWKSQTLLLAQRIFGKDHPLIKMIQELKYDYSSWHLRDVTGNKETEDPVLLQARQVMDAAVSELESLGLPTIQKTNSELWTILEEELTGKLVKELNDVVSAGGNDRENKLKEKLNALKKDSLVNIISRMML